MAKLVYSKILIEGAPVLVTSNYTISLHQKLDEHHYLNITCPTDSLESITGEFAAKAKQFIGASIAIQVGTGPSYGVIDNPELEFNGIVTNVSINQQDGSDGIMTITGYSPTILLSHGKDSQSYEKKDLAGIISEATSEYPSNVVKMAANPAFSETIPYTVQYKEDDFSFISRLAARYGEWFFYDGETIQFGKLSDKKTDLVFGQTLESFNFSMQTRPQDHTFFAYDAKKAEVYDASMSDFAESVSNPYVSHVTDVSKKVYRKKPKSLYNHSLLDNGKSELDFVAKQKAGAALNTILFTGESEMATVQVGSTVTVKGLDVQGGRAYGSYIVIEVQHTVDSSGRYTNLFTGIPEESKIPPYFSEDAVPLCEEQYAIVMDNNDPDGLSRIRVQFPWQKPTNQMTPWLRVTTPYAGDGKGFHVLPEVGEEVLISFEGGCAEKPVVIGAMFHGSGKSGHGGAGNFVKGFTTASGNKVEMNDENGTVTVSDPSGNTIVMNGDGTMTISAPDKIDIVSKEINILGEDLVHIESKIVEEVGTDKVSIESNTLIESKAEKITEEGTTIEVNAKAQVNIEGKAMTNVKGATVNLN